MADFQYRGPEFSDGPFCKVRVLLHPDDGLQTYTAQGGVFGCDAAVLPEKSRVNTVDHFLVPTWRLARSK